MKKSYRLQVDPLHELHLEEWGRPDGVPILFVHGGPGAGCSPMSHRYFDPDHYRIILFDQRGAGQSTPFASIENNTTWDLIEDIEKIRRYLQVDRWIVFGGSWGATLALAYAQAHPTSVGGLILRGILLCDQEDLRWLLYEGAPRIWPKEWEAFVSLVALDKRHDLIEAYWELIHHPDEREVMRACRAWMLWEARNLCLEGDLRAFEDFYDDRKALALARIELHYFRHLAFLEEGQLLKGVGRLKEIPTKIIHGRYDTVCPFSNSWKLHRAWPGSELIEVESGGHGGLDPAIHRQLLLATEAFKAISLP